MVGLALDLAKATGCCQGSASDNAPTFWTWDLTDGGKLKSQAAWFGRGLTLLTAHLRAHPEITDIITEKPMPLRVMMYQGSNEDVITVLRGLIGVAWAVANLSGIKAIYQFDPKDCRQAFTGRRTFPKGTVKGHIITACRYRKWDVRTGDEADACCLWDYWRGVTNPRMRHLFDPVLRPQT